LGSTDTTLGTRAPPSVALLLDRSIAKLSKRTRVHETAHAPAAQRVRGERRRAPEGRAQTGGGSGGARARWSTGQADGRAKLGQRAARVQAAARPGGRACICTRPCSKRAGDVLRSRPGCQIARATLRRRAPFVCLAAMKLKQLQALLEDVEPFAKPKVALEQYVTGALQRRARWLLLC